MRARSAPLRLVPIVALASACNSLPSPPPYLLGTDMAQRMSTAGGEVHLAGAISSFASAGDLGFSVQTSRNIALGADGYGIYGLGYGGRAALRANPFGDHFAFVFGAGAGAVGGIPYGTFDTGVVAGIGGPRDWIHFDVGASAVQSYTFGVSERLRPTFYAIAQAGLWFGPPQVFSIGLTGAFDVALDARNGWIFWYPAGALTIRIPINDRGP